MENRLEGSRTALALLLVVAFFVAVATVVSSPPALASDVEPTFASGNPSCSDFTSEGGVEFKIPDDVDVDDIDLVEGELGPISSDTYSDGVLIVTLTIYETEDGMEFNWMTNFGVDVVVVKGGPDANVYFYVSIETSDDGLHSPFNETTEQWYGLSHVSFCYFAENATTTTTSSTTTTSTTLAEEEETTTTTSSTTTTVASEEETTTTTSTTTTTTLAGTTEEPTTTTTIEDEVLGTVVTTTTEAPTTAVEDEVLDTEVTASTLPFTGVESEHLAMLAMALVGGGLLVLVGANSARGVREE